MEKQYQVSDLFYTEWKQLSAAKRVLVHELNRGRLALPPEQQGTYIILIMRALRKRPLLVDRLNEAQVVDIFNSLTFLAKPWLFFAAPPAPLKVGGYAAPDEKLGNLTFDHFIYADSEFTQCNTEDEAKRTAHMLALCDILYRPGKLVTNGKYQLPPGYAKVYPAWVKQAFYTFGNVRDYIVNACVHLFPPPAEDEKPTHSRVTALQIWTDMKFALAEQGTFGTYKEVGEQPLYEVIWYLEKKAKEPKPQHHGHTA